MACPAILLMQLFSLTVFAVLVTQQDGIEPGIFVWEATDWVAGCSPAACGWGFNIIAQAKYIAAAPAFRMTCGALFGVNWTDCRVQDSTDFELTMGSKVQAWWPVIQDETADTFTVRVSHTWYDATSMSNWNATGEAKITRQTDVFRIVGKRIEGIVMV